MNSSTRILFCGAGGRMCRAMVDLLQKNPYAEIVCGVDITGNAAGNFPVYTHIADVKETFDVIIDFSHHSALPELLAYAVDKRLPVVVCTTGHTPEEIELMRKASAVIPVFFSRNMSVGINLLIELCKKAAAMLGEEFNIEIVEAHHGTKLDAPSGTALMIADALAETVPYDARYVYDRHEVRKTRDKDEIGIHSIRAGTIVGEHSVIFGGPDELITISHSAASRSVFANGAIRAAVYLVGKPAGMYNMNDIVQEMDI